MSETAPEAPAENAPETLETADLPPDSRQNAVVSVTKPVTVIRDGAGRLLPGHSLNPNGRPPNTPLVAPRLRRYLEMPLSKLEKLDRPASRKKLTMAENIALTYALDALTTGGSAKSSGDKSRRDVLDRVDGPLQRGGDINVGVQVVIREYGGGDPEKID